MARKDNCGCGCVPPEISRTSNPKTKNAKEEKAIAVIEQKKQGSKDVEE